MGYDSRLFIIRKPLADVSVDTESEFLYAETIAIYEMGVFPPFGELFCKKEFATKYAPFAPGDGENPVIKDSYGDSLTERSLAEVIECLSNYLETNENDYARVKPLLVMLKEWEKARNIYYNLTVLHYGH